MQEMLRTDPYLAKQASRDGRLFLARTIGPLSGGTNVTTQAVPDSPQDLISVEGWIQVPSQYRGNVVVQWKRKPAQVLVSCEDLVIRRKRS